jgi:Domain of unknown function (DUF305)
MPVPPFRARSWFYIGLLTAAAPMALAQGPGSADADHAHSARQTVLTHGTSPIEQAFLAQNDAAMSKMMANMTIKPTGDIDRDFVTMMVPHHQGAIDMAMAVLRYGRNEQVRRLAQEIIVTQQQEIMAMRLAVSDPLPPGTTSQTQATLPERIEPTPAVRVEHHSAPVRQGAHQ